MNNSEIDNTELMAHEFFHAMFQDNIKELEKILKNGLSINYCDKTEASFLLTAISFPSISVKVCKFLIKKGINVNAQDIKGNTALHYVESFEKLKILLDNKIDINCLNNSQECALEFKLKHEKFKEALALIDSGANYHLVNWEHLGEDIKNMFLVPLVAKEEKNRLENGIFQPNYTKKVKL